VDNPGMGYIGTPTISLSGINTTLASTATAYLDPGFNQILPVTTCTFNYVEVVSGIELSSTGTQLRPSAQFSLVSVISELNASNKFEMVSPTKLFKTGDKVRVLITSNKAGYITSSAISPQGILTIIGEQKVAADETITVPQKGSIKFDGQTGIEELLFVLSSKSGVGRNLTNPDSADLKNGCKKSSTQRDLVIENSSNDFFLLSNDGKCLEQNGKSRDLVVESDQNVDYGVVPENQFSKGNILGLKLYLKHN
jgi:hypothetical protein